MTPKLKRLFIAVIVVQVVFLLGLVGYRESILTLGRTAVLQTVPVDPRDLFRGEFVVLRYEISTLGTGENVPPGVGLPVPPEGGENGPPAEGEINPPRRVEIVPPSKTYLLLGEINKGDTVYVGLPGDDDDLFQLLHVQTGGPSPKTDLFIRGRVTEKRGDTITIEYGIEQYFVPEGKGLAIERADDVKVRVSINRSGTAAIKELIVDGEVWQP
ncbi:MAG: GDYXXLXY domain-containing protein [Chloroflexi bacterium]|nr:GDYXXLXY domain-containing protein [Chloroflexota bacterium]